MTDFHNGILIVEDEPAIAQEISLNLEEHGFKIAGIFHSSAKALEYIQFHRPDLILLDIAIRGGINGVELAKIINEKYKIPFIYITSFSDSDTVAEAANTFPEAYIIKPFKEGDLAAAVTLAFSRSLRDRNGSFPDLTALTNKCGIQISKAEYNVIKLLYEGKSNLEISETLFVSVNTIKTHINNIFIKFDVHTRMHLATRLREMT